MNLEIVTKYKLIFIKSFTQLRFNALKFILVLSICPKSYAQIPNVLTTKIETKSSSSILNYEQIIEYLRVLVTFWNDKN